MLTEKDGIWSYFKRKTKTDKGIFKTKVKKLEHIRNIVSYASLVDKNIDTHFLSLYVYFTNIIDNLKIIYRFYIDLVVGCLSQRKIMNHILKDMSKMKICLAIGYTKILEM